MYKANNFYYVCSILVFDLPQNRSFDSEKNMRSNLKSLKYLAQLVRCVIKCDDIQSLIGEWKQLAIANDIISSEQERLDVYWKRIFELNKYPLIKTLVQTLLCIQPYNAAEERGFNVNATIVTKERNRLQEDAVNGIRRVRSHLQSIGGLQNFVVTPPLIDLARTAFKRYAEPADSDEEPSSKNPRTHSPGPSSSV